MQFVLNNQIGRTQRRVFQGLGGWQTELGLGVEGRVFDFRRLESMPLAEAVDLPEEHLHFALPRHLGELVHRGDEQRRQAAINLFIHHDHRQALVRRLPFAEQALSELVAAVGQRATGTVGIRLGIEMLAGFDGTAAPRASGELVRSADATADELIATSLLDRFDGIIGAVGRGLRPTHRPMRKGVLSPAFVAVFECLATNRLAGTNQCRGPLELLNREQSQRVPHQHGHAFIAHSPRHDSLQSPQGHRVGRQAQVGFRFTTARGKEEQVGQGFRADATFGMIELRHARQVEQDERNLERSPTAICLACRSRRNHLLHGEHSRRRSSAFAGATWPGS